MAIFDDALHPVEPSIELSHYGRKGMKWGQRIFSKGSGRTSTKKKTSQLTDDEINQRIARLELEKKYQSLLKDTRGDAKPKSKTVSAITGILGKSGTSVATTVVTAAMLYNAKRLLTKKYGQKTVDAMFGKK